jgi:hypothetical protein
MNTLKDINENQQPEYETNYTVLAVIGGFMILFILSLAYAFLG